MWITTLFYIGIIAESMSGALAAGRFRMDLFGVFFISFVTALGGGSIRDIIFDHYPLLWVHSPHYVVIVFVSSLIAMRIAYFIERLERFFLTLDALGLAVFSTIGAKIVIGMEYGLILAMIGAVVTGSFGGILRDLFCNRIPLIFQQELYAGIAMLCGAIYWLSHSCLGEELASSIAIGVGFCFRMLAIKYKISLPIFDFANKEKSR